MRDWPVFHTYTGDSIREIVLPIGGIGTGFFGLGGRGHLTDWQLMSRVHRGWRPLYCHFLIRTKQGDDVKLRVCEGDVVYGLSADSGSREVFAGIPRFKNAQFDAAYPFGQVSLWDEHTPITVSIEGFNPLIPGDTDASSLPFGLLSFEIENLMNEPMDSTIACVFTNFIGADGFEYDLKDNITEEAESHGWKGMRWWKARDDKKPTVGTMAILSDAADVRVARTWVFRDRRWNGEVLGIIDSLIEQGYIPDERPGEPCPPSPKDTWDSSVCALTKLAPREKTTIRFLIAWHFPWRNIQASGWSWSGKPEEAVRRNYYATKFRDAMDVADRVIPRLAELRVKTLDFVRSVCDRSAPLALKEAALFNLTSLRSHTCFRLDDGVFYGFEGCSATSGCCHGSCTHVWNYEEATVNLYPDLHRSMVESHCEYGLTDTGAQRFRLTLPMNNQTWNIAAADGQMGLIVRIYQQYTKDRDVDWLRKMYPKAKRMLEFAWVPNGWDADRDGVMEGAQHNTYDVEFFGPNPLCTVWYLAALKACAKMAELCDDKDFAEECEALAKKGAEWVDQHLYNGKYYEQKVQEPKGELAEMTSSGYSPKEFQVGNGCLVDQLCGQYKANRAGLGPLLDELHIRVAVRNIFLNNFRDGFRDHYNNMRTYAIGDEQGTLICSYPSGNRPAVPFSYWAECMTGFEYQLAVLLLDYGYKEEGLKVAKAVRDRHAGHNRNPFNEPECGSYYARAMAAWALLDAWDSPQRAAIPSRTQNSS